MTPPSCHDRIYLDHNATTPLRPEVVEVMHAVLRDDFGNPSSTHAEGARARAILDQARERVARSLAASEREIFFTAGATEANNTLLQSFSAEHSIVTTDTEHPSVVAPLERLEAAGSRVTRLPVDDEGLLDLARVEASLESEPQLVSIIWANNETGVLQPIAEIAKLTQARGIPLHVDATQAVGKLEIDLSRVPVATLSCSAHKLNGPKGTGCLFVREDSRCRPLLLGGPQERGFRGGTENLAGIAGFGVACELASRELGERMATYRGLRDRLWNGIVAAIPGVRRNGSDKALLCNTLNLEFEDTAGDVLLQALDLAGVAVSAGAACHSGSIAPSHVLSAMGRSPEEARGSLRFSVGHGLDEGAIDRAIEILVPLVARVRAAGPA